MPAYTTNIAEVIFKGYSSPVRKKLLILLSAAAAGGFLFLFLVVRAPADPLIDGTPTSQWTQKLLSPSYAERDLALSALRKAGSDARPHLIALLRVRDQAWQPYWRQLAGKLKLAAAPPRNPELCQTRAAQALLELRLVDAKTLSALVAALPRASGDAVFQIDQAIRSAGKEGEAALREALSGGNAREKETAAKSLAEFRPLDSATIEALQLALNHSNGSVRQNAAATLGKLELHSPQLAERLARMISDPEPKVRAEAALAMGNNQVSSQEALQSVEGLLADPEEKVRLHAAVAHWKLSGQAEKAVPVLSKLLAGPVGWQAAYALGDIGPAASAAVPHLVDALQREQVPRIMRTPPSSALALGKIGRASVARLTPLLQAPKPEIQIGALLAYGYMGSNGVEAIGPMEPLLDSKNQDVRHAAALAMAEVGADGEKLIAVLTEVLEGSDIYMRSSAATYLRRLAPEQEWVVAPE
ncbi:MAG: HEAT repeat domain-containing protein [Verrucomicrobiales bacterium]